MPTTELPESCKRASLLPGVSDWRTWAVVLIVGGVAPFFVQHLINLWRYRPHYEFVPVVLIAFVWLSWKRWPRQPRYNWGSRVAGWTLLLLGLAFLAAALVFYSPWGGAVAAVLAAGGVLFLLAGRDAFGTLLPVWLLLWMVVPPPFRLDDQLIHMLQRMTSHSSSVLLESVGVHHLLEGNVFRLPDRELFVAEACSGIHSQLVLIAASILLVITLRRTWIHAILLIAASICFSALVNTVRVTSAVFVAARWDWYWSTGWQHEVLGYVVTLIGFLLLISADLLLTGLLAPVLVISNAEEELTMEEPPLPTDPLSRLWNLVVACVAENDLVTVSDESGLSIAAGMSGCEPDVDENSAGCQRRCSRLLLLVAFAFGCLGLLQVFVLLHVPVNPEIELATVGTRLQENTFSLELDGWQCAEYRFEEREAGSDAGQFSHVWRYVSDDRASRVSVDFPYLGWHELTRCYTSIGWIEVSRKTWRDDERGPFVEVLFSKPAGEVGHLSFSLFDETGQPVEPRISHWRGWRSKLAQSPVWSLFGTGEARFRPSETTIQFQRFLVSRVRMNDEQERESRELYLKFRQHFLEHAWGKGRGADADE